ncbi:MAG: hypothetical protein PHS41_07120 [Victivallaceae bacterium]|nr:hypothetical protein [Victivallaceae bacterium]
MSGAIGPSRKLEKNSPGIFWYWNANPTPAGIVRELASIKKAKFRCVYLHPMSDSFQKHFFFRGMDVSYLGRKYFELVKIAVAECKRQNLTMMLYDESGWPSGGVLNRLLALHPEARRRYVDRAGKIGVQMVPDLIGGIGTDYFIEMVYERYARELGDEFGRTIRGIFTDEPFWKVTFSNELMSIPRECIPLPEGIERELKERFGVELAECLPKVFDGKHFSLENHSEAGEMYLECCTEMFARNYSEKLASWCEKHNLQFEGHFDEDDGFFTGRGTLSPLRVLAPMHVPGVDAIWRMIYPGGGRDGHYARFAQAAAIRGRRKEALCECFNVYGYYLTTEVMSWIGNMLLTKGINKLLMMPYLYSDRGMRKICCGTDISPRIPLWNVLPALNDFWNWAGRFDTGAIQPPVWVLIKRRMEDPQFEARIERMFHLLDEGLVEWRLADARDFDLPGARPEAVVVPGELTDLELKRLNLSKLRVVNGFQDNFLEELPHFPAERGRGFRILRCRRKEGESLMVFNTAGEERCFRIERKAGFAFELLPPDPMASEIAPIVANGDFLEIALPPFGIRILSRKFQNRRIDPPASSRRIELDWEMKSFRRLRLSKTGPTHYQLLSAAGIEAAGGSTKVFSTFSGIAGMHSIFDSDECTTAWIVFERIQSGAEFFCNGISCGVRAFAPWGFKVNLKRGKNQFRMNIFTSAGNEYLRCAREELEPAGWFNDFAAIRKKFVRDDLTGGVSPQATLFQIS